MPVWSRDIQYGAAAGFIIIVGVAAIQLGFSANLVLALLAGIGVSSTRGHDRRQRSAVSARCLQSGSYLRQRVPAVESGSSSAENRSRSRQSICAAEPHDTK